MTRYRIVPERSRLWVEARSSVHPIRVDTTGVEGTIDVEIRDGRVHLDSPPAATIELDAERLKTGNILYDLELARRLDFGTHARIRGEVRQVIALDPAGRHHVRGDLSLHGVTSAVEGDVTVRMTDPDTIEIEGEQTIDVRDFGLEPPRLLMLRVYPDVRIRGYVVAKRQT